MLLYIPKNMPNFLCWASHKSKSVWFCQTAQNAPQRTQSKHPMPNHGSRHKKRMRAILIPLKAIYILFPNHRKPFLTISKARKNIPKHS
jgi:hypothetical protein